MYDRGKRSTDLGMERDVGDQERIVWADKRSRTEEIAKEEPSPCMYMYPTERYRFSWIDGGTQV